MGVFRYYYGDTRPVDFPISASALPACPIRGFNIKRIRWHTHFVTGVANRPVAAFTFPAIAGGVEIAIRGHLDGDTSTIGPAKTVFAFPSAPIEFVCCVRILRYRDREALPAGLAIAAIASPSISVTIGASVLGDLRRIITPVGNIGDSGHKCQGEQRPSGEIEYGYFVHWSTL